MTRRARASIRIGSDTTTPTHSTTTTSRTPTALRSRQPSLVKPNIDERQHRLQILLHKQTEETADIDEMDEARVQLLIRAQMPELQPVSVVDVRVGAHHLAVDVADVRAEGGREAGCFAEIGSVGAAAGLTLA